MQCVRCRCGHRCSSAPRSTQKHKWNINQVNVSSCHQRKDPSIIGQATPTERASLPIKSTSNAFSTDGIYNFQNVFFFPQNLSLIFHSPNIIAGKMVNFYLWSCARNQKIYSTSEWISQEKKSMHDRELNSVLPEWHDGHTDVPWWKNSMALVPRGHTLNNLENG